MKRIAVLYLVLASPTALAHHGVAGVGAASLEGPGAPIESATSATLPDGSVFGYLKLDHAKYKTFDPDPANPESDFANFWIAGLGYGITPWFSAYVFVPYHEKVDEPGGFTARGFADISVTGQIGFKYDQGLRLLPENETADDLEDWHFTVFAGLSVPTGNPNLRDANRNIDPGKSTGFGKPSFSIGATATILFSPRWTFNAELSHLRFQEYRYDDGNRTKFGSEYRANGALNYRLYSNADRKLRVDLVGEAQYLRLDRDETNGMGDLATGGAIGYLVPGVRLYWNKISAAFGVKKAVWTDLNDEDQQQGAEGRERYRLILSISSLF
ncbi:MAG: transporter [Burkholderiales bacterium]